MTSFCTRPLLKREVRADNVLLKKEEHLRLQSVQQVNCMMMMEQLKWVVTWSSEIFNNVLKVSEETGRRITKVKARVEKLKDRVPAVEALFMEQNPAYFYDNPYTGKRWKRKDKKKSMKHELPFDRMNAPDDVNRFRMNAMPLPDLKAMDAYMDVDDRKMYKSCIKKYSMPEFFQNVWVKKEEKRLTKLLAERKQRRRKKKRHGKAKRVIEGVTRKQYNEMGEHYVQKGTKTILEGDQMEFDVEYDEERRNTMLTNEPAEIRRRSVDEKKQAPPPVSSIKPKQSSIPEGQPASPPPAPGPGGGGSSLPPPVPVVNQNGAPPLPPSMMPPPQPKQGGGAASGGDVPDELKKFVRMYNIMKNAYAVINRMKREGYTEVDFQKWIDPTFVVAQTVKRKSKRKSKIQQAVKKPPARPNPMGGGGAMSNVLAGIRKGPNLKKAGDRKLKLLPKPKPDAKTQLMNAIQTGIKLKKVDRSAKKKKDSAEVEDAMADNPVMALLRLREKMAMTDSEDSSEETSSSEDWDE